MVVAIEQLRPLTIDDLEDFPDNGNRREIITGELFETPSSAPIHQILVGRLAVAMSNHVDRQELGYVIQGPVDVELSRHDITEPDIVFVSNDQVARIQARCIVGPPDLVVEVTSPSSRRTDVVRKRALYARSGIPEYWIVDPERRSIEVLRLVDGVYEPLSAAEGRHRSIELDGLVIDAAELFRALPGGT